MSEPHFGLLAPALRPLLDKFYRAHRSPMRAPAGAQAWVARRQDILAALCLSAVDGGHWLTGLLVAPAERRQGLSSRLLKQALAQTAGPVWLFCHPQLVDFYQRLGFAQTLQLPPSLAERLTRYQRHKQLVAMAHGPVAPGAFT
jgi:GNAT superfamily N-acetyltransferase